MAKLKRKGRQPGPSRNAQHAAKLREAMPFHEEPRVIDGRTVMVKVYPPGLPPERYAAISRRTLDEMSVGTAPRKPADDA